MDKLWSLVKTGYNPEQVIEDGNRFLIANGYMGVRGTVEEAGSAECPAVNLAGVYDRYQDKWREPVNAPNPLFSEIRVNGSPAALGVCSPVSHRLSLDYRQGVFCRDTEFSGVRIQSSRIASMAECHLLLQQTVLSFPEECEAEIVTGISTDIWNINGPHLFDYGFEAGETLLCTAVTGQQGIPLAVAQRVQPEFDARQRREIRPDGVYRILSFHGQPGKNYTLNLFASVYTGLDGEAPAHRAEALVCSAAGKGFDRCAEENRLAWEKIWADSAVTLEGDEKAALALHASQYYLNSIAPRHAGNLSIPARGLSGQTYKGAIFWDSEVFLLPMFLHTQPEIARSLLRYRIETLPGALKKATEYGYRGAFYAWESQDGGEEGCTNFNVVDVFTHRPVRTYFRDKQIHISADIAYAMWQYYLVTGDRSLLDTGGAEVILQCARFYISRANPRLDRDAVDFADVIGPDEYHERVTNNAFTNQMALHCIRCALHLKEVYKDSPAFLDTLTKKLDYGEDWQRLVQLEQRIAPPKVKDGVLEQFDGYFDLEECTVDTVRSRLCNPREYWGGDHGVAGTTRIIKQADVLALMAMLPEAFSRETVRKNWDFYEPRTEHGSSLSACMYALTACRVNRLDKAWELFLRSACLDIWGSSKQWAGEIYIGGTHPAANGGAWMIAVLGFAGLQVKNGKAELSPNLPKEITCLRFPVTLGGKRLRFTVTQDGWHAEQL